MSRFKDIVIAAAVLVIFSAGGLTAFQVADWGQDDAPDEPRNVTNESLVVEYDAYQFVNASTMKYTTGFDNSSIAVRDSGNQPLDRGTDYEWNNTDGTILFLNTSATSEGETATIDYTYYTNTPAVRELSGPLDSVVEAIGWVGVLAAGFSLVVLLVAFGGFVAARIGKAKLPQTNR